MMTDAEFADRLDQVIAEENAQPEQWWYLSFAGERGFLGAAIVRGRGVVTASLAATCHGANPGGECVAVGIGDRPEDLPEQRFRNRLLSLAELREAYTDGIADVTTIDGELIFQHAQE